MFPSRGFSRIWKCICKVLKARISCEAWLALAGNNSEKCILLAQCLFKGLLAKIGTAIWVVVKDGISRNAWHSFA